MDIMTFVTQPQVLVTIAILIMLLWRISYGYRNGIVAELLEIAGLAVAFVVLMLTADVFDRLFSGGSLHIVQMIIRIVIVVAIYRVIQGLTRGAKGVRKIPIVGTTNRLLGVVFGFVETYIWVYLLDFILGYDFGGAVTYTVTGIFDLIKS